MTRYRQDRRQHARIAIIGMACRLPGDIDSPRALWRALCEGRDTVGQPSATRLASMSATPTDQGSAWRRPGGYLREVAQFDAQFFGISGREAAVLDPQQRLMLEVAWEALEHAGQPVEQLAGSPTGVFAGVSYHDYMDGLAGGPGELEGSVLTNGHCVVSGRISYALGLHGPSLTIDTACSSSLVALHLAVRALRAGECDLALAGGVSLILDDRTTRSFTRMRMLSPTGRCHSFDAAADGFVRGEGCGVVVVKRLADAVRDADRVLAVIRGSAVNQDGRSNGLAAPSAAAQGAVIRRALSVSRVDPRDVGMVEAHGTGTPVGDPVELSALARAYGGGPGRCAVGSVKTNIGHLEPAAGVVGVIKAAMSVRNGLIPPSLHFNRWNAAFDASETRLFVPSEPTPWPDDDRPRLAAVSSFGFSGTNAHLILEQAPTTRYRAADQATPTARGAAPHVFLVAAGSAGALPQAAKALADWLEADGAAVPLRDLAHTLATRRSAGCGRLGVLAHSREQLLEALRAFAGGQAHAGVTTGEVGVGVTRKPVWVFSGQGSQWAGMGRVLLDREPAFRAALAEVDSVIKAEAGFSVLEIVRRGKLVTGCGRVQPTLFALQVALAATWRAHGIEPVAVIGHSMGEVAAAVVSGALSLADGARVICRRSILLSQIAGKGAMASVSLNPTTVKDDLDATQTHDVSIAVLASPESTVVAGDPQQIEGLVAGWNARGVPAQRIAVDVASHCAQVDPLLSDLAEALMDLSPRQPAVPLYSTVLDDPRDPPAFDAAYWCANLRRPVRFASAVHAASADRHTVFVEVSPHPVLRLAIAQNVAAAGEVAAVLPTLVRDEDDVTALRTQLAALHCAGVSVDWSHIYPDGELVDPPFLTFDRKRHWTDTKSAARSVGSNLLGPRVEVPGGSPRHCWRTDVGTAILPWLADHRVSGAAVFPGAAYWALALSTACEALRADAREVELGDFRFRELLPLAEHTELTTSITLESAEHGTVEISARSADGTWVPHASATVRKIAPTNDAASISQTAALHSEPIDPALLYKALQARGLEHGRSFAGIEELSGNPDGTSFWATVQVPGSAGEPPRGLPIHPVLLDLCAQTLIAGLARRRGRHPVLPVAAKAVRLAGDVQEARFCHAQITDADPERIIGDVRLLGPAGEIVATIEGLTFLQHQDNGDVNDWFLDLIWRSSPPVRPADVRPTGSFIVVGSDEYPEMVARELRCAGAAAESVIAPTDEASIGPLQHALVDYWRDRTAPGAVVLTASARGSNQSPHVQALSQARRLIELAQAVVSTFAEPPRLFVVTQDASGSESARNIDLGQSSLAGIMRVLTCEHPELRATLIDVEPGDAALGVVVQELLSGNDEDEIALHSGMRRVARLVYAPLKRPSKAARPTVSAAYERDGFHLRVGEFADLSRLDLTAQPRRVPGPGEVELRVHAAGINFRDVLTAMGLLGTDEQSRSRIGFECSGEVTAVGRGVEHLRVGDTVVSASLRGGAFASFATVPAAFVVVLPPGLDPVAAATVPIAFATAWYALRRVARLDAGERILIHSAAGGTGLAAIQVARLLGAEVLATAGSAEKRSYLRSLGIEHVMDSRSLDFAEQARAATGGEGVDVVLNALPGPAIEAGLRTLRPFGRFVELGVRDIIADAPMGMAPLRNNITFSAVDLIQLQQSRPNEFAAILRAVLAEVAHGRLVPLPHRAFSLADACDGFRFMASAGHTGKLLLTVPSSGQVAVTSAATPVVRGDGTYVVTGGLRGIGFETVRWLIEQGAGHVIVNGRTPPGEDTQRILTQLRAHGARITVLLGDIAEPGTAERLVSAAGDRPLRGIMHAAMVLNDAAFINITEAQLVRVWRPKVDGAWRLHQAVADQPLDWFVVHSSMTSALGNAGQGAYAAANSWLDAFAAWRTAHGRRTLAVNWGPWGETGAATDFASRGYQTISTSDGLRALGELLASTRVRTAVIPGEPATWVPAPARDRPIFTELPGVCDDKPAEDQRTGGGIVAILASSDTPIARRAALEKYLVDHIREVLRLRGASLDPQTPLKNLGFDSLLSMELRARLQSHLGVTLSSDFVYRHTTVAALAEGLDQRLGPLSRNDDEA
ncbi:MAG TPA: type I polyketide synthase [Actinocrinis sp.]|nr:type I polyketide synthase [Actinocrinis sp.]